jgi:pimeloyl-ACP methyl ester carboxylesterase
MRIRRDGIALAYEEAGTGAPAMLLVHGWGTDRSVLGGLHERARDRRRVVGVDLRGFGDSDAPEQPYTIASYADDLAFVAQALDLERPIVVGHSMGGMIALDLAARYPDQVSAAIILEGMVVAPEAVAGLPPVLEGVRQDGYQAFAARLMAFLAGPHIDPAARERLVASILNCRQRVLISAMEGILAFDSVAAAAHVKCSLLYVGTGARYADLERFRQLCPQLVTGQLVGCGHYFPLEVLDQLDPMIERFVQTHVR